MNKLSEEERLAYRKRYWDDCFGTHTKAGFKGPKRKQIVDFFEGLYFGEPFRFDKKLLTKEGSGHTNLDFCFLSLIYQQHQTPEVWENFLANEAPRFGIDTFEKMIKCLDPLITNTYCDPMKWGWVGLEDYEFFKFWFGRVYQPNNYTFMHAGAVFPFSASVMSSNLTSCIFLTLAGYFHHECRFVYLYDYWKQVLLTLDPEIFHPESHTGMACFTSLDASQAKELAELKKWVAILLSNLHSEKASKKSFNESKKVTSNDQLPTMRYGMASYTANAYWQLPNLVMLRQSLTNDILTGELPESIAALNEWASHPDASPSKLLASTLQEYRYRHPATIAEQTIPKRQKPTKDIIKPDINKEIDELVIPEDMIKQIGPRLEEYRQALRECGVPVPPQPVTGANALKRLLKANQVKCAQVAMSDMEVLSNSGNALDYLRFLMPQYIMELDIEPFDGCSEPEINGYYRDLWQGVRTMTIRHKKINALKATRKESDDEPEEYDVSVNFETEDREFSFEYEVKDSYADSSVIEHLAEFHKASDLPWKFFQDSLDDTVIIYYLPESAQKLLPGSPDVIV